MQTKLPLVRCIFITMMALQGCKEEDAGVPLANPDVEEDSAILAVGDDPAQRYSMSMVGFTQWDSSCRNNLCLVWSQEGRRLEFRLAVPQMSGTLALSDSRVILGYTLPDSIAGEPLITFCRDCTGSVTLMPDITDRALRVAVDGVIATRSSCTTGWCGTWIDVDAYVSQYTPCDGGVCLNALPCNDAGIAGPAGPFCPNSDYKSLPITIKARTSITE